MDVLKDIQKICVVGSPGAGKSTFTRKLKDITGLPVIHLDKEYWRAGWTEPDKDIWLKQVEKLVADPTWIIDGNYSGTYRLRFTAADAVIFLDCGRWTCLWRAIKRSWKDRGQTRLDMADDCPEKMINFEFLWYILWQHPRKALPKLQDALDVFGQSSGKRIFISRSFAESDAILQQFQGIKQAEDALAA